MNKFLLSLLIGMAVLVSSCSNEDEFSIPTPSPQEDIRVSKVLSEDQVSAFADKAVGAFLKAEDTPALRSKSTESRSTESVTPILSEEGLVVMYAVNFTGNGGYMLLSANKESETFMLAFNDKGSFVESEIDSSSPIGEWLEEKKASIAIELQKSVDLNNENYKMWEAFSSTNDSIEIDLELVSINPTSDGPTLRGRHKNSWGLADQSVGYEIYYNTWGQGTGYNANAKLSGAPVGCPAVAVGLLCSYWWFPSGYEYWNMPTKLNTSSPNAISRMFRDIADKMPGYTWSSSFSGATGASILTGLKSLGYKNAVYTSYNFNTVYSNISNGYPVLLGGVDNSRGGHIWICDGYWEQQWKVTRKILGITVDTWYEYVDMLYMNWGWNGSGNAWIDQADWNSQTSGTYNRERMMWYNLYPVR